MSLQKTQLGTGEEPGELPPLSAPLIKALSDPQTLSHASRGSQTLIGLVWVPVSPLT